MRLMSCLVDLIECMICCKSSPPEADEEPFEGMSDFDAKKSRMMRRNLYELTIKSQMLDAAQVELQTYKRMVKKKNELIAAAANELDDKDKTINELHQVIAHLYERNDTDLRL
ncbi:hypothetical protein HDE_01131 [Halotydeus destructor]|nr:hypothetical protein HDE_01131 [Halotydeus destructor]